MSADKGIEILVGVVILGALGWSLTQQYEDHAILQNVDTRVANTHERVNRIADALPDMNVRLAFEEVHRPLQSAIVATRAVEDSAGQWTMRFHIVDSENSKLSTFVCSLDGMDDQGPIWSVMGLAYDVEPQMRSASSLTRWSAEINEPYTMPAYIEPEVTLCFLDTSASVLEEKLGWLQLASVDDLASGPLDWKQLVATVRENPDIFQPSNEFREGSN